MYLLHCLIIYILQVECQDVDEATEAARAGAHIVMLDNFSPDRIAESARRIKNEFPHVLVEASGVSERGPIYTRTEYKRITWSLSYLLMYACV